jgi:glycogen debranching enzyme
MAEAAFTPDDLVLKLGNAFVVSRPDGSIPGPVPGLGFHLDDCRHLSRHAVRADGATARVRREIGSELEVREEIELEGAGEASVELDLEADFEPMLAIRGFVELERSAPVHAEPVPGGVRLSRTGLDGVRRTTTATFDPAPEPGTLRWRLEAPATIRGSYRLDPGRPPEPPAPAASGTPRFETDDPELQRVLDQAMEDLRMLRSTWDGQPYIAAGIPWYATLFGRDSLIAATQLLGLDPSVCEGTLRVLAAHVGRVEDPIRGEQPGKVAHELRPGEPAAIDATPLARYYGAIDSTALFLCTLAEHARTTGDTRLLTELEEPVERMLEWIEGPADSDGDGLLDHPAPGPGGLRNQGWKDSDDGVIDGRGEPLGHPIALVEAQGYAIRARRELAALLDAGGEPDRAAALRAAADRHAEGLERFWLPERHFYAMAIDGRGDPSPVLASNQGHLLWAGVLEPERARAVRDALMGEASFSGWGIRTLAAGEPGYDPDSYHRGSVWPHDTALIAAGLLAHGFEDDFITLLDALVDVAVAAPDGRLPELFSGDPRDAQAPPRWIPGSCRPQAWAAGALPHLVVAGRRRGLLPTRARRLEIAARPSDRG